MNAPYLEADKQNRRDFLYSLAKLGLIATSVFEIRTCKSLEAKTEEEEKYTSVASNKFSVCGVRITDWEFGIESKVWDNLPAGLSKQDFYNKLKKAGMQTTITTQFAGFPVIHPSYINKEEIIDRFMKVTKDYIKYNNPELDSELEFNNDKQRILRRFLEKGLKSSKAIKIKPWIGFTRWVPEYPPGSKIFIRKGSQKCEVESWTMDKREYIKMPVYQTYDKETVSAINDMFNMSILSWDSLSKKYPIDRLHEAYQDKKKIINVHDLDKGTAKKLE